MLNEISYFTAIYRLYSQPPGSLVAKHTMYNADRILWPQKIIEPQPKIREVEKLKAH